MPCYRPSRSKRTADTPQDTRWQPSQDDFELLLAMLFQSRIVCFPTKEERVAMANRLNVTERQVQVWCQNKRQKLRESGIGYSDPRAPALVIAERGKVAPASMSVPPLPQLPTPPKSHRKLPKVHSSRHTNPNTAITPIELAPVSRVTLDVTPTAFTPPPPKLPELVIHTHTSPRHILREIVRTSPFQESPIASSPPELSFDDDDELESIATASEFSSPPPHPTRPTHLGLSYGHYRLSVQPHPTALEISDSALDLFPQPLSLSYDWLRDSCQCPQCVHPSTKQKLFRTGDFARPLPTGASFANDGSLHVQWQDGHPSVFSLDFLRRCGDPTGRTRAKSHFEHTIARRPWDLNLLPSERFMDYEAIKRDPLPAYLQLLRYGILIVRGLPHQTTLLHCIKNRVEGGTSVFVDAIKAANDLWHQDRASFELAPPHLQSTDPSGPPEIAHINYSPPFQAPLAPDTPALVYTALRKYAELLARPHARFEYTLAEGDCAVFDNRRVLHARTAFWDKNAKQGKAEETNRWLKGCYVEVDDLWDRTRVLLAKAGAREV
ncbi:gamma-butyrobetaine dioxygenase [Rhizoctonia solani]|uniref:Gamma-butyrobetaine dioxygenase n=1 Tax=Rhizoctonia solani TaxID=456999 RepID=A0A8H8P5Q0_9AGAM|nr:gamma-butyrobetaine dioxygenase [Rhizoctonia solani]QRW26116.1 gamma-butyrobetaine dioxygenase [Rhizoctonia solani]